MKDERIERLAEILRGRPRVAVLTGAGISAESGIPTFRGKDGLWKQFRAEELATPEAFDRDPKLVWEWYDWRRGIIGACEPNEGHRVLARWEKEFPSFVLITQNIDGLHRKAGSAKILELHGNIWQVRCVAEGTVSENYDSPLRENPPRCPSCGELLRPNVVWFGEALPAEILDQAYAVSAGCELMFVIGTSAYVQPAASLPLLAAENGAVLVEVNPDYTPLTAEARFSFRKKAGEILPAIDSLLSAANEE
ncbi:MAG: NAD-dependent deacylase [Acidobacteriota bacterium]